MQPRRCGGVAEIIRHDAGVFIGPLLLCEMSSVSSERISIQQELGSSCVPSAPRQRLIMVTSSLLPLIEPPTRSLWPPTYLVSDSSEISAPCFNGF